VREFGCGIVAARQQAAVAFVREAVGGGAFHGAGPERAGRRGAVSRRRY